MKRILKIGLLALALLIPAALAGIHWLRGTDDGRDFALRQVQGQLPSGATLRWQRVSGHLGDRLRFEKLVYADATQRYEAGLIDVDLALWPLLFRQFRIGSVQAQRVYIDLPRDDEPFAFPRWPDSLPALDLPFSLEIGKLQISDLQIAQDGQPVYALKKIDGGFHLQPGALSIPALRAVSPDGSLTLSGFYQPNHRYHTRLQGVAALQSADGGLDQALTFNAEGDEQQFRVSITGEMPDPIRLQWQLASRNRQPFWNLEADSGRFQPKLLGFTDESTYRFNLSASGDQARIAVQGELDRDGQTVVIKPSQLKIEPERVVLERLQLLFGGGQFSAKGSLRSKGELGTDGLTVDVVDYPLPLDSKTADGRALPVVSGSVRLSGKLTQWRATGEGRLVRGKESARFRFDGSGSQSALEFTEMDIRTAVGGLNGKLKAQWQPNPDFAFNGRMDRFDPGYFHPDFPGAVNADVQFSAASKPDTAWQGLLKIDRLGGQLRGRALAGTADLRYQGLAISGKADLKAGQSHVVLDGSSGKSLDVRARLQPLDLSDINPNWSGRIAGDAVLKGDKARPLYDLNLQGDAVRLLGYQAGHFTVLGNTISGNRTRIAAEGLMIDTQAIDRLTLDMTGRLDDARIQAMASVDVFSLQTSGRLRWSPALKSYLADNLRLDAGQAGIWHLQEPATFKSTASSYSFTPFCLAGSLQRAELCAHDGGRTIDVQSNEFPLALIEPYLNTQADDFIYKGTASIQAELPKDFDLKASGFIDLTVPSMVVGVRTGTDAEVTRIDDLRIRANWMNKRLNGTVKARLQDDGYIDGELDTGFAANAPLSGGLKVRMNRLDWLELFTLDIANPAGRLAGEVKLDGTRDDPVINGAYQLQDFSVEIPGLGLRLNDGQITAKSTNNLAMLIKGSIRSGDGRLAVTGVWDPVGQLEQPLDLRLIGKNVALADTPNMQLHADIDVLLGRIAGIYSMQGDIHLLRGLVNLETIGADVSISNDVIVVDPVPEKAARDLLKLSVNLKVNIDDSVRVKGFGLDGTVQGSVAVNSPYDRPTRLTGSLNLLGTYGTYGQKLRITRGIIQYNNAEVDEPILNILAERTIDSENMTVGLQITGPASKPKTQVISSAGLSENEALSWLMFGQPLNSVSSGDAEAVNAKSMALNAGGSFLVGTLGQKIGLDQATLSNSRVLGDSTLTVGEQLSPRFFVSYGVSLLGLGQIITLKYLLIKGLDATVEYEQTQQRTQNSAGLNWRK
jgi:translocation and assembly module TamB